MHDSFKIEMEKHVEEMKKHPIKIKVIEETDEKFRYEWGPMKKSFLYHHVLTNFMKNKFPFVQYVTETESIMDAYSETNYVVKCHNWSFTLTVTTHPRFEINKNLFVFNDRKEEIQNVLIDAIKELPKYRLFVLTIE